MMSPTQIAAASSAAAAATATTGAIAGTVSKLADKVGGNNKAMQALSSAAGKVASVANTASNVLSTVSSVASAASALSGANSATAAAGAAAALASNPLVANAASALTNSALGKQASALASSVLSKAGGFTLPDVQIPNLNLPDINAYINKISDAFDVTNILDKEKFNLQDQLSKIEDIREQLESIRQDAENLALEKAQELADQYLGDLKSLGGCVSEAFDDVGSTVSDISSIADSISSTGDLGETLAGLADSFANGELGDASAIADVVNNLTGATGTAQDSIMKAVFGDDSGKAGEAVAKADSKTALPRRGNSPCGKKTKTRGGVNYNEAEGDEEDAQTKAQVLVLFNTACNKGNMDDVEKYFTTLTTDYKESPILLKSSLLKIASTAPQTKAGITRVNELYAKANELLEKEGSSYRFGTSNTISNSIASLGDGVASMLKQSKNMVKSLSGNQDYANKVSAIKQQVTALVA